MQYGRQGKSDLASQKWLIIRLFYRLWAKFGVIVANSHQKNVDYFHGLNITLSGFFNPSLKVCHMDRVQNCIKKQTLLSNLTYEMTEWISNLLTAGQQRYSHSCSSLLLTSSQKLSLSVIRRWVIHWQRLVLNKSKQTVKMIHLKHMRTVEVRDQRKYLSHQKKLIVKVFLISLLLELKNPPKFNKN